MSLNECKVTKVEKRNITIHMVTSPEEGELVNSQIVETAKGINASSNNTEELVKQFTDKYPDYRIPLILQMTAFMFYEYGKDQSS